MACTKPPAHYQIVDGHREIEQPHRVCDSGPAASQPACELLLRQAAVVDQLTVSGGLLYRVEVGTVNVLDESSLEGPALVGCHHHDGDVGQAARTRSPPPALPGDQLVTPLFGGSHEQRLQQTQCSNRRSQLCQGLLIEVTTGLIRVRNDVLEPHLEWSRVATFIQLGRQQGVQAPAQAGSPGHDSVQGSAGGHASTRPAGSAVTTP